uniref:Gypsy retrotransposon integrase-like protein 1 n=1 Tax=Leptobrachium leishanense TaxID=445787 RepID=A0A8C5PVW7_9ANUR
MCVLSIDGKPVTALLDSGSVVTLVRADFISLNKYHPSTIGVICVHGDTRDYQTAVVEIGTPWGSVTQFVGVVPSLLHEAIVGRDFSQFWRLWEKKKVQVDGAPPTGESRELSPEPFDHNMEENIVGVSNEGVMPFPLSVMAGEQEDVEPDPESVNNEQEVVPGSSTESGLNNMPDLEVRKDDFHTEQMNDSTLTRARENIKMIDGRPIDPDVRMSFPYMIQKNDLLYQVVKQGEDVVEQLVVPKPYRRMVLDLAHGHIMGGHLGIEKTKERISQRFFWPGLHADVKEYCESCPECQYSAPSPHFRSPLVPLPIIEVPFKRIGMDLVGPVVKTARGHQCILVILDYATRYPEAIPLRNTSAKTIAKELVQVFSRVGIAKEILTDQGTPFMSRVTRELCRLFKISHLRTSVYHPQTDGLVERFIRHLRAC